MTTKVSFHPAKGGFNQSDSPWRIDPGELLLGLNYECMPDGYKRIDGYERFDGHPSPSEHSGAVISFSGGQIEPKVGSFVYGSVSGASGIITGVTLTSGGWFTKDATGVMNVDSLRGFFTTEDQIVSADDASGFSSGFSGGFA